MVVFCGTTDELCDKIAYLEDDIVSCQNAMTMTDIVTEKSEYRLRIVADQRELAHLKTLRSLCKDWEPQ